MKKLALSILILVLLVPMIWVLFYKFEGNEPVIDVELPSLYLKKAYEMSVAVSDDKTGLREIQVSIFQKGREKILLTREYDAGGFPSILSGANKLKDSFVIPVESWKYGMTDGDAIIRIRASDYSWRGWNKGNIAYVEHEVKIDSVPPKVNVLTRRHNVERGGTGLVVYRLFEEGIKSGVRVGENFFPGYPGLFDDKMIYTAFFALDHLQGPATQIAVIAEDMAGNVSKRGFYHYIRDKKFKSDTLNISDGFLQRKMPGFDLGEENNAYSGGPDSLLKKFLYINGKIRELNAREVLDRGEDVELEKHWQGRFSRLEGSARRAGFADRRVYKYNGKEIDRAVHLGVDLASTANAPVKAANSGRIVLTKEIGIFGNTVIIDHGFGLYSLYAHLSQISVNTGDMVTKADQIGLTGMTGLAGGDHLHFSMIVHNVFVNPLEWWDASWIENNITSKIEFVKQLPN